MKSVAEYHILTSEISTDARLTPRNITAKRVFDVKIRW